MSISNSGSSEWANKISQAQFDALIEKRKADCQRQNILTWDAWWDEASTSLDASQAEVHLILEAPISPWEVEMHRDKGRKEGGKPAPACIRCEEEDSDESDADVEGVICNM